MIARKSALIMANSIINGILGYIAIFLVARYMQAPDYALGVVGFAYGFVSLFHIFDNLGFNEAHVKRVSEGKDLSKCIGTFASIKIVLTGLMAILMVGSIFLWEYIIGRGFESPEHKTAVYVMLVYFIIWSLTQTMLFTYRGRKEIAKDRIPFLFETVGRVAATAVVVITDMGAVALATTYVVGEVALFLTAFFFFRGYPLSKPSMKYVKLYAHFALPLAIAVASTIIMTNIDKVLIQLFWSATEVGNYFAIFRLSKFLNMATIAIGILLFPTISALHGKSDLEAIKNLSFKAERYLSMMVFPVVFFMIFLAKPIIHILLSNKFYAAIPLLQILPIFTLFDALERPYQMKLLGMNLPHFARNRIIIMVIINVILNIVLIPKDMRILGLDLAGMGATGASIATVVAYFVGLTYTRLTVWKVTNVTVNYRIAFHFIAALIMGTLLYSLNNFYPIARWYELLAFGFIGVGIYVTTLYILKEFTREDFDLFKDTLNIKKMFGYIKDEIKEK